MLHIKRGRLKRDLTTLGVNHWFNFLEGEYTGHLDFIDFLEGVKREKLERSLGSLPSKSKEWKPRQCYNLLNTVAWDTRGLVFAGVVQMIHVSARGSIDASGSL